MKKNIFSLSTEQPYIFADNFLVNINMVNVLIRCWEIFSKNGFLKRDIDHIKISSTDNRKFSLS